MFFYGRLFAARFESIVDIPAFGVNMGVGLTAHGVGWQWRRGGEWCKQQLSARTGGGKRGVGSTQVVVLAAQVAGTGLVCEAWAAPRPTLYSATVATSRQRFHRHAAASEFVHFCLYGIFACGERGKKEREKKIMKVRCAQRSVPSDQECGCDGSGREREGCDVTVTAGLCFTPTWGPRV